jgi:CcmD family protein
MNPHMKTSGRLAGALTALATLVALPAAALAQEFEKVRGPAADEVPAGPFVGIAYGFIWVAILTYVVSVARGVVRLRGELDEVRRRIDRANAPAGKP